MFDQQVRTFGKILGGEKNFNLRYPHILYKELRVSLKR